MADQQQDNVVLGAGSCFTSSQYQFVPFNPADEVYFGAATLMHSEWQYIHARRGGGEAVQSGDVTHPPANMVGLALSGGGIRSASFSLGAMQALAYAGWLKKVDYLSTVSGGGYIGSSLTWMLHRAWDKPRDAFTPCQQVPEADEKPEAKIEYGLGRENFPFGTYPVASTSAPTGSEASGRPEPIYKGRILRYLRQHARYLTPGNGHGAMALIGVVLRNSLFSLWVYGGLLLLAFFLLGFVAFAPVCAVFGTACTGVARLNLLHASALAIGALFLVWSFLVYPCFTWLLEPLSRLRLRLIGGARDFSGYRYRFRVERQWARALSFAVAVTVIGLMPPIHHWLVTDTGKGEAVHEFTLSASRVAPDALELKGKVALKGAPAERGTFTTIQDNLAWLLGSLSTLLGVVSSVAAFVKTSSVKKGRIPIGLLAGVGAISLIFGFGLLAYHIYASGPAWAARLQLEDGLWMVVAGVFVLVLLPARLGNLNHISIHRYYRDRLMETFMPDVHRALDVMGTNPTRPDQCLADETPIFELESAKTRRAPYHIINTNIVLAGSHIPKFRARGGDNFVLTPYYCGSNATGWCSTKDPNSPFSDMTFATAMATSGAAVNPNTGVGGIGLTRQPLLSLLMGVLNIRLGNWNENPAPPLEREARKALTRNPTAPTPRPSRWRTMLQCARELLLGKDRPNALSPGVSDLFLSLGLGEELNENSRVIQLTDGGHFENLGLYELLRRRLKLIIVCDASADHAFAFEELANAIEKVRADFGVLIDITTDDLEALTPQHVHEEKSCDAQPMKYAKKGFVIANITYHDPDADKKTEAERKQDDLEGKSHGTLIYLTTTFFEGLSPDLFAYRKGHPDFPDQPTSDQFFDERQFEAYRELGFQTANWMMCDPAVQSQRHVRETVGAAHISCPGRKKAER